jgi:hypothetical protein
MFRRYVAAMTIQAPPDSAPQTPSCTIDAAAAGDRTIAEIGVRLLDDAYMAWLAAESEAEDALCEWTDATTRNRADTYRAYLAAVDREDAAASDLGRLLEITGPCIDLLLRRRLSFHL